jgi:hypothetical protein
MASTRTKARKATKKVVRKAKAARKKSGSALKKSGSALKSAAKRSRSAIKTLKRKSRSALKSAKKAVARGKTTLRAAGVKAKAAGVRAKAGRGEQGSARPGRCRSGCRGGRVHCGRDCFAARSGATGCGIRACSTGSRTGARRITNAGGSALLAASVVIYAVLSGALRREGAGHPGSRALNEGARPR